MRWAHQIWTVLMGMFAGLHEYAEETLVVDSENGGFDYIKVGGGGISVGDVDDDELAHAAFENQVLAASHENRQIEAERRARAAGFNVHEVPGDGNCCFQSFCVLSGTNNVDECRQQVVDELARNCNLYSDDRNETRTIMGCKHA